MRIELHYQNTAAVNGLRRDVALRTTAFCLFVPAWCLPSGQVRGISVDGKSASSRSKVPGHRTDCDGNTLALASCHKNFHLSELPTIIMNNSFHWGARGGVVVKTLRYKPASRGFDSRWCHWNFSVT